MISAGFCKGSGMVVWGVVGAKVLDPPELPLPQRLPALGLVIGVSRAFSALGFMKATRMAAP